jgi:hypothetical protein
MKQKCHSIIRYFCEDFSGFRENEIIHNCISTPSITKCFQKTE